MIQFSVLHAYICMFRPWDHACNEIWLLKEKHISVASCSRQEVTLETTGYVIFYLNAVWHTRLLLQCFPDSALSHRPIAHWGNFSAEQSSASSWTMRCGLRLPLLRGFRDQAKRKTIKITGLKVFNHFYSKFFCYARTKNTENALLKESYCEKAIDSCVSESKLKPIDLLNS